ncbi:Gm7168 [Symbiodinium natans]|uniref:Gm7168 protein n=1 Tax=Symbiodinium natans TaxID=878477 RepID=A0A812MZT5_9DINO|nr:Gm7168 [Symbiodinium natans]
MGSELLAHKQCKGGTLREVLLRFQADGHGGPASGGEECSLESAHHFYSSAVEETWSRMVTKQTLQAMAYCHGMRIIHKDLKDENVMLLKGSETSEPFVVIIDLGVACRDFLVFCVFVVSLC